MKQKLQQIPSHGQKGYTLVEVLMVMAIFSIGILGAMVMQTSSVTTNATSRKSTLALEYATDTMERLMLINPSADDLFNIDDDGDGNIDEADEADDLNNDGIDNDGNGTADDETVWHQLPEFTVGLGLTRGTTVPEDAYYSQFCNLTWDITDIDCDGDGTDDAKRIDMAVDWDNDGQEDLQLTNIRTNLL